MPYVAATNDLASSESHGDAGVDVFWKPNGDHQLTATIHPDFGQVEADELVVNFSAQETFFSDKRPFFTENQSVFELRTPEDGLLLHTRRVGAASDDGRAGVSDIDWGLKANGALDNHVYGVLLAQENNANESGRSFQALRWRYPGESVGFGYLGTHVDRPYLERDASVHTLDYDWRINAGWSIDGQSSFSHIQTQANADTDSSDGYGSWLRVKQQDGGAFNQQLAFGRESARLDYNDFGFQARSNYDYLKWRGEYRDANFNEGSIWQSRFWQVDLNPRRNGDGVDIPDVFRLWLDSRFRDTQYWFAEIFEESAGYDDLLTRGNNLVKLPAKHNLWTAWGSRQDSNFRSELALWLHQEGLSETAWQLEWRPSYVLTDALTLGGEIRYQQSPDWLIWQHDNTLGRYERDNAFVGLNLNWIGAGKSEFRFKLQWLAIDATAREALNADADGHLQVSSETPDDFTVNTMGVQARYRYMIGPMSDLFVVYSRGGFEVEDPANERGVDGLLGDSFSQRDNEQFMVKLRYRL